MVSGLARVNRIIDTGVEMRTFDPLDEDGEVVDGHALAAHSELWWPGWEVDGFRDESGDVWVVDRQVSEMFFCIMWAMPCHVPRTDVMQTVTSG